MIDCQTSGEGCTRTDRMSRVFALNNHSNAAEADLTRPHQNRAGVVDAGLLVALDVGGRKPALGVLDVLERLRPAQEFLAAQTEHPLHTELGC